MDIKKEIRNFITGKTTLTTNDIVGLSYANGKANVYLASQTKVSEQNLNAISVGAINIEVNWKVMAQPSILSLLPIPQGAGALGQNRKGRFESIPPGVSCGHPLVTAGTTSFYFKDNIVGSNAHVFTNPGWKKGDPITQPGRVDGGKAPGDTYATVEAAELPEDWEVEEIEWDFAYGKQTAGRTYLSNILDLKTPAGVRKAVVGETVKKSGRTSEITSGEVIDVDVDVNVIYLGSKRILVKNCNLYQPAEFVRGGDSGSPVLADSDDYAVDIVFAGSVSHAVGIGDLPGCFAKYGVTPVTYQGHIYDWKVDFEADVKIPVLPNPSGQFEVVSRTIEPSNPKTDREITIRTIVKVVGSPRKVKIELYDGTTLLDEQIKHVNDMVTITTVVKTPSKEGDWILRQVGYYDANE